VLEVEKKEFLANQSVLEAHPAGQARILCDDAASPKPLEIRVGQGEERTELLRRKPEYAK
jgi:hypothetical protein